MHIRNVQEALEECLDAAEPVRVGVAADLRVLPGGEKFDDTGALDAVVGSCLDLPVLRDKAHLRYLGEQLLAEPVANLGVVLFQSPWIRNMASETLPRRFRHKLVQVGEGEGGEWVLNPSVAVWIGLKLANELELLARTEPGKSLAVFNRRFDHNTGPHTFAALVTIRFAERPELSLSGS